MAREQIERVKLLLETAKVTTVIQDSVLFTATISGSDIVSLVHQIDEIYSAKEHELLSSYVSLEDAHKGMEDARNSTLNEVEQLIMRSESYYKAGDTLEKSVVSHIKDDFNNLKRLPKT